MYKSKRKQNFLFNQTTLAVFHWRYWSLVETRGDGDVTEAGWTNRQTNKQGNVGLLSQCSGLFEG